MHYSRLQRHNDLNFSGRRYRRSIKHKPEYKTWDGIKQRCLNQSSEQYKNYGGRGIKMCDRWSGENGFWNFYKDMGPKPKPSKDYSLDRIDVNGDYEPNNCRWTNWMVQASNKRTSLSIPGVRYNEKNHNKKWSAYIRSGSVRRYKSFYTQEEAVTQRKIWEKEYLQELLER